MSLRDRPFAFVPTLALVVLTAACGGSEGGGTATDVIPVAAADDACEVQAGDLEAGTHEFVVTNGGSTTTEFYVYAEGDRVMAEVENIDPGLSRKLLAELPAGTYEAVCKPGMAGEGVRQQLTVIGEAAQLSDDESLAQAGADYQRYVRSQTAALLEQTSAFVDAVTAGDLAGAKALYPVARTYWERIEPVAEVFGDLDPRIDGREGDQAEGEDFTGFHRIEKALWQEGDVSGMGGYADQLLTDVEEIVARADETTLEPLQLANGAKALLDEVAGGKITGEEDRYSHTDLWDFQANVEGSKAAIAALRPVLVERDAGLVKTIDAKFAAVDALLAKHAKGSGFKLYTELSKEEIKKLATAIDAVAEPGS